MHLVLMCALLSQVLLGTTPQGVVSFVSEPWGGRVSDKYLTEHSKLCKHLLPRDVGRLWL